MSFYIKRLTIDNLFVRVRFNAVRLKHCIAWLAMSQQTKSFYAVGVGRNPGVYNSWLECKSETLNMKNAKFRKFSNLKEAWNFVKECQNRSPLSSPIRERNNNSSQDERSSSPSILSGVYSGTQTTTGADHSFVTPAIVRTLNMDDSGTDKCVPDPNDSIYFAETQAVEYPVNNTQIGTSNRSRASILDSISLAPTQPFTNGLALTQSVSHTSTATQSVAGSSFRRTSPPKSDRVSSLDVRLSRLETAHQEFTKQFSIEMKELKNKFDELKEANNKPTKSILKEIALVLTKLDSMDKRFTDSQLELRNEINQLNENMKALNSDISEGRHGVTQTKAGPSKSTSSNASIELLSSSRPTVFSKRKASTYSPKSEDSSDTDLEEVPVPPRKVVKIELTDSEDETDKGDSQYGFQMDDEGYVIVYTDGACENNGRYGAKAGIGVWFADNHPLNCSEPVQGRPTNNMAEIQAASHAVEVAKKAGVKKLLIKTDSQFTINCITKWIRKWKTNNWKVATGQAVKNKEELLILEEAMRGIDVKWQYVPGHQGVLGNEKADNLAKAGAMRYGSSISQVY